MRIIFMGTPDFAVPCLNALVAAKHEIICVVAQPDKAKGRGKKFISPATIQRARELGIPTKQPRAVRRGPFVEWMSNAQADLAVVVAYGRILIPKLLNAPRFGCINVHASLLPKYRGAAPIQWAVVNGETETGVCTMQMNEGMDTGDILLRRAVTIQPTDTSMHLWERLSQVGAELLVETLDNYEKITPQVQNHENASYAPILKKSDGLLDWQQSAVQLCNRIRGLQPWPGAWTWFRGETLKIWSAQPCSGTGVPGQVLQTKKGPIIATGSGAIRILECQLPGKKRGPAINLVNGTRLQTGEQFGQEP